MKPTQEQVIAWAREAGIGWLERAEGVSKFLGRFAALAYEAGRKDENEACEKICKWMHQNNDDNCGEAAAEIRARREQ